MTRHTLTVALLFLSSPAFADEICRVSFPNSQCPASKNSPDCPEPKSLCAGPLIPIAASLVCHSVGWGVMACFAYPTSVDGIFTYQWSINGQNLGLGGPEESLACTEGPQHIFVTVSDVYGQTETVDAYGYCRDGYAE